MGPSPVLKSVPFILAAVVASCDWVYGLALPAIENIPYHFRQG